MPQLYQVVALAVSCGHQLLSNWKVHGVAEVDRSRSSERAVEDTSASTATAQVATSESVSAVISQGFVGHFASSSRPQAATPLSPDLQAAACMVKDTGMSPPLQANDELSIGFAFPDEVGSKARRPLPGAKQALHSVDGSRCGQEASGGGDMPAGSEAPPGGDALDAFMSDLATNLEANKVPYHKLCLSSHMLPFSRVIRWLLKSVDSYCRRSAEVI